MNKNKRLPRKQKKLIKNDLIKWATWQIKRKRIDIFRFENKRNLLTFLVNP